MEHQDWPSLRLADWEPTYLTLHRWTQIIGKLRLAREAPVNHWWHVPFYVTSRGLTTTPVPCAATCLTVTFDFKGHRLIAEMSDGKSESFALEPMSAARLCERVSAVLNKPDIEVRIRRTFFRECGWGMAVLVAISLLVAVGCGEAGASSVRGWWAQGRFRTRKRTKGWTF